MSASELRIEQRVAWLSLNRPELHNAFDDSLIAELCAHLEQLAGMTELRALVLLAEGRHFSAGADLHWMKRMASVSRQANIEDARRLAMLMERLDQQPIPVLARVQGAAFGGAIGLLSCCDIVIAAETSRFALSEVRLGLAPATIAPYVMAALGKRRCRQLFLSAQTFSANQALEFGLVHEVVPEAQLDSTIERYLTLIRETSPHASRAAKALLRQIDPDADKARYHELTCQLIADLRSSEDGQSGLFAFLNKQTPPWIDRT
jgi:methylglutaconyl-CoA hydratase